MTLEILQRQYKQEVEYENRKDEQGTDTIGNLIAIRNQACAQEIPEMNGERFAASHDICIIEEARNRRTCRKDQDCSLT